MVDLKVLLPSQEVISVSVRKNASTVDVYGAVVLKTGMQPESAKCFALFEIVEYHFGECELDPNEKLNCLACDKRVILWMKALCGGSMAFQWAWYLPSSGYSR